MTFLPGSKLGQAVIQKDLKKREEFIIFGSNYRVEFEQRVKIKNGW
jgi:hypothetical protein